MKYLKSVPVLLLLLIMAGCGTKPNLGKKPIDTIIRDYSDVPNFSIILYDMDTEGTFFKNYLHQYRIIKDKEGEDPEEEITGWHEVSKDYFMYHVDNMGMEIAAKKDGEVTKTVSPPGYGSYVGNPKYGHWVNRGGNSFWEFYGKYAFMSSMFNMMAFPVRRTYWNDYYTNYYGTGRIYYGPSASRGTYMYGTRGNYTRNRTGSSRWFSNASNSSVRQRVRSSTPRSTRSGTRYSSSSRSRSGSFGK